MPIQLPTQPVPLVNGVTIKNEPQHVASGSYIAIDPNTGLHYKVFKFFDEFIFSQVNAMAMHIKF
jgi:hypothetical protein